MYRISTYHDCIYISSGYKFTGKNLFPEYLLCLTIVVFLAKRGICVVTENPMQTSNVSNIVSPKIEDDDDFVPYQGERFTVFDWMLFKVSTHHQTLIVIQYI